MNEDVDYEFVRARLAQALTRCCHPHVREDIRAALSEIDPASPTGIAQCPVCYRTMHPTRLREHECPPVGPRDLP